MLIDLRDDGQQEKNDFLAFFSFDFYVIYCGGYGFVCLFRSGDEILVGLPSVIDLVNLDESLLLLLAQK